MTNGLKAVVIQLASALDNTERRNEMCFYHFLLLNMNARVDEENS